MGGRRDRSRRPVRGAARLGLGLALAVVAALGLAWLTGRAGPAGGTPEGPANADADQEDPGAGGATVAPRAQPGNADARAKELVEALYAEGLTDDLAADVHRLLDRLAPTLDDAAHDPDLGPREVRANGFARLVAGFASFAPELLPAGLTPEAAFERAQATATPAMAAGITSIYTGWLTGAARWDEVAAVAGRGLDEAAWPIANRVALAVDLSLAERARGNLAAAAAACARAEGLLATVDEPPTWSVVAVGLERARVDRRRGLTDLAAAELQRLVPLAERLGDAATLGQVVEEHANACLAAQTHGALDALVERSLEDPLIAELPGFESRLRLIRAISLTVRGRSQPESAREAGALLDELLERDDLDAGNRAVAQLRGAELALADADFDGARRRLEAVAASGALQQSDETLRRMLALRLAREVAATADEFEEARRQAAADLDWFVETQLSQPLRSGGRGFLHFGEVRGLLSEMIELELAVAGPDRGARSGAQILHRVQALGTRARRAGYRAEPLEAVTAAHLPERHGLLLYLPAIARSHLFAIDRETVQHFHLPPLDRIAAARTGFNRSFAPDRPATAWDSAARELRAQVLPPAALARIEAWDSAAVIGLDLLRYIPFELLPLEDGRRLGEVADLSYMPSLPQLVQLAARSRPTVAAADLFLVAAPAFADPDLIALPFGPRERERLLPPGGESQSTVLSGPEAHLDALAAADLSAFRLLHVVTHGIGDRRREQALGLALAPGPHGRRELWPDDVARLAPLPPVVVLSACRAGRSTGRLGEGGLDSFIGSFFDAGAECVLIAHVDVDYGALLDLSEALVPRLLAGAAPASALAAAQAELRRRRPDEPAAALLHAYGLAQH